MGQDRILPHLALIALLFVSAAGSVATAQWSGRKNELVIYAISKKKAELQIAASGATNAGRTGFEIIDSSRVAAAPLSADFPAKQVRVLHRESDDLFELITNVERIPSPRQLNQVTTKILFLDGLLRNQNPGSVSTKPLDVTGGLYVPFFRGIAAGPDIAIDASRYLLWSPSASTPPFIAAPDEQPSQFGPAGLTGVELEAVSGVAAFFVPWVNLRVRYPSQAWTDGVDTKILDGDPVVGNSTQLIRLRPGKSTPQFSFTNNTHLFVLEGNAEIQPVGAAITQFRLNSYAFVPSGFSIAINNPKTYSGPGASQ